MLCYVWCAQSIIKVVYTRYPLPHSLDEGEKTVVLENSTEIM